MRHPTSSRNSLQELTGSREYDPTTAKRDYRSPADEAEARLYIPIADACDVELQAAAHDIAGPGRQAQLVYVGTLEELRRRKGKTERRAHNSKRVHSDRRGKKNTSTTTTRGYEHIGSCRSPIPVALGYDDGTERYRPVGCGNCEPCQKKAAEITAEQARRVVGETGYLHTVSDADYRAMITRLTRHDAGWYQVPAPKGQRRVIATEPAGPSVPVDTVEAARTAQLARPTDDHRRSSYRGQRSHDPEDRPATRDEIAAELFPAEHDGKEDGKLLGFWHLSSLRIKEPAAVQAALQTRADTAGVPAVPAAGGIEIAAGVDQQALDAFRRSIGFVPLAKTRHLSRSYPSNLPIAEAYELWRRWQETTTEPPVEVYDVLAEQLALEVAS